MPPSDEIPATWGEARVFWSTIGYLRAWWGTDGPRLSLIRDAGGITPEMLRSIAVEYNVNRLILRQEKATAGVAQKASQEGDKSAGLMCDILKEACAAWPTSLVERAEICAGIAKKARKQGVAKNNLASASTKFMWFLKPDGWTVYDGSARAGLSSPTTQNAVADMLAFYKTLQKRGFPDLVAKMNAIIGSTPFKGLPAERILDTMLMAEGGRGGTDAVPGHRAFLDLLPEPTRAPLIALAAALQREVGNEALLPPANQKD